MRVKNFLRHQAKTRALAPRRLAVALSAGRRPICQRACGMQLDRVWRALLAPLPPLLPIALSLPYCLLPSPSLIAYCPLPPLLPIALSLPYCLLPSPSLIAYCPLPPLLPIALSLPYCLLPSPSLIAYCPLPPLPHKGLRAPHPV